MGRATPREALPDSPDRGRSHGATGPGDARGAGRRAVSGCAGKTEASREGGGREGASQPAAMRPPTMQVRSRPTTDIAVLRPDLKLCTDCPRNSPSSVAARFCCW